jgi:hypothetical protein
MELVQRSSHSAPPQFPTEIFHHIFSFIDNAQALATLREVCKLFLAIVNDDSFDFQTKMFSFAPGCIFKGENLGKYVIRSPYVYIKGNNFYAMDYTSEVRCWSTSEVSCWSWNGNNDCIQKDAWYLHPPSSSSAVDMFSNFTEEGSIACSIALICKSFTAVEFEKVSIEVFEKGNKQPIHRFCEDFHSYEYFYLALQKNFLAATYSWSSAVGELIASELMVFSLPSEKILHTIRFENQWIKHICSDSKLIAVYMGEWTVNGEKVGPEIKLIDVQSGQVKHRPVSFKIYEDNLKPTRDSFYLDDGKIIALTTDGNLKSIEVETGRERTLSRLTFDVSSQSFRKTLIAISNHKAALFTKKNTSIELYDLKKWECLTCFPVPLSIGKIVNIFLHKHFLAAVGETETKELDDNNTAIYNYTTIVWHPFLPNQEGKDLSSFKPFSPTYKEEDLDADSTIPFTNCEVAEPTKPIIDDSHLLLDESLTKTDGIEEAINLPDGEEAQELTISIGDLEGSFFKESPTSFKDLPTEEKADMETERWYYSCFYSLCACFKWLFCKIFNSNEED